MFGDVDYFTPTVEAAAAFERERGEFDYDDERADIVRATRRRRYAASGLVNTADFAPARTPAATDLPF